MVKRGIFMLKNKNIDIAIDTDIGIDRDEYQALKTDIIAFFEVLKFYEKFQPKCMDAINQAQKKAESDANDQSYRWNQLGDSLWQILPKIDRQANIIITEHNLKSPEDQTEFKEIDTFHQNFNTLLTHLALAIKITNKILEDKNKDLKLDNTISSHPIEIINTEILKNDI
jgi:hypothetical protein